MSGAYLRLREHRERALRLTADRRVEHWAVKHLAASLFESLGDAPNFVTTTVSHPDLGAVEVTVQRIEGKPMLAVDSMPDVPRAKYDRVLHEATDYKLAMHEARTRVRELEGMLSETRARLQAAERHAEESRTKWSRECNDLRARLQRLRARPKLWVVRGRGGLLLLAEVDVGDCGDALPCIAAFDRRTDADYVAGCVGGTVEEWGAK